MEHFRPRPGTADSVAAFRFPPYAPQGDYLVSNVEKICSYGLLVDYVSVDLAITFVILDTLNIFLID